MSRELPKHIQAIKDECIAFDPSHYDDEQIEETAWTVIHAITAYSGSFDREFLLNCAAPLAEYILRLESKIA